MNDPKMWTIKVRQPASDDPYDGYFHMTMSARTAALLLHKLAYQLAHNMSEERVELDFEAVLDLT